MSIKGSFASRKKQKQANTRLKKPALVGRKNQASGMREKAALIHMSAAKKQADNQLAQTQLAAIEPATKMGLLKEMLKGLLKETLGSLFAIEKSSESATAATSSSDVETEQRASAAMVAAKQLSMMSGRGGVAGTVSGSDSDIEVVEVHEGTDQNCCNI